MGYDAWEKQKRTRYMTNIAKKESSGTVFLLHKYHGSLATISCGHGDAARDGELSSGNGHFLLAIMGATFLHCMVIAGKTTNETEIAAVDGKK